MADNASALHDLARLYGVQLHHHDGLGTYRTVSDEALVAILRSLGASIEQAKDAPKALREERTIRAKRTLPPVVVAWSGKPAGISMMLPAKASGAYTLRIAAEDGTTRTQTGRLDALATEEALDLGGEHYRRATLALDPLPLGYHRATLELGSEKSTTLILCAPEVGHTAPASQRTYGVFAPLYALRSKAKPDSGDLGTLERAIDWVREMGGSYVGTLPLLASMPSGDPDIAPSPYAPASRLFWNELYLDLSRVPELAKSKAARDILESEAYQRELDAARREPMVDWPGRTRRVRQVLGALSETFFATPARVKLLEARLAREPRLRDYAEFRAAAEKRAATGAWSDSAEAGKLTAKDFDEAAVRYHLYAQFAIGEQLEALAAKTKERGEGLYLDIPLGVDPGGYDVWRERSLFVRGVAAGSPPDGFFTQGQNWGFPPMHPGRLRDSGYAYFAECIRNQMKYAGALRIDHVMGLHRLYWVPEGMQATEGAYVEMPHEELYAVLALESTRAKTWLAGEDLGTVPSEVRPAMQRHGVARMYVLQFDLWPDEKPALRQPPSGSIASLNTHDMPPFGAFLAGADIDDRIALGLLDEEQAKTEHATRRRQREALVSLLEAEGHLRRSETPEDAETILDASLAHLGSSRASTVLVSLDDLWLDEHPHNVPGTWRERPNWKRKLRYDLEDMERDHRVRSGLAALASSRKRVAHMAQALEARSKSTGLGGPIGEHDFYLLNEGTHHRLYEKLGAHPMIKDGVAGVRFAVWAPNAERVSVVGDFNYWSKEGHPLEAQGVSGVFVGFVPGLDRGALYKYRIFSRYNHYVVEKADPFGFLQEEPPKTASIVWDLDYAWEDDAWMNDRHERHGHDKPISAYEVHLGSWMRREDGTFLSYREIAPLLAAHVTELGFTHVELMPVAEHPFYGSWGYQGTGYYAPTHRYGKPQDFMFLVDTLHKAGVGVILDWVPAHFPTDEHGLGYFDGTHLYEHADARRGFHPDWKSFIFNYDRHEVRSFLLSNAMFWLDRYHIDGLRIDAVASMLYLDYSRKAGEWIPNDYGGRENLGALSLLRMLNERIYAEYPDVQTIAEESTAWPMVSRPTYVGGLGFGFKWDMGWMHDTLQYIARDPVHRKFHHHELTFRMLYAFTENFVLPLSHDEVVHGKGSLLAKMPGDEWQKFANLRLLYGYMFAQPGKKLLFMGSEIAPWTEWSHERSLEWFLRLHGTHAGIERYVRDLNHLYRSERAMHELDTSAEGFEWIHADDVEGGVISLIRKCRSTGCIIVAVLNFTPIVRDGYRIGVPRPGHYDELLNSDAQEYGGSGVGNYGGLTAEPIKSHGRPYSIAPKLPPLGILFFRAG